MVMSRGEHYILRSDGQRKKGRLRRSWRKEVEEEGVRIGLSSEDTLCRSMWSVRRRYDFCWVEVNLATITCWEYYQILDIGVSLCDCPLLFTEFYESLLYDRHHYHMHRRHHLCCILHLFPPK